MLSDPSTTTGVIRSISAKTQASADTAATSDVRPDARPAASLPRFLAWAVHVSRGDPEYVWLFGRWATANTGNWLPAIVVVVVAIPAVFFFAVEASWVTHRVNAAPVVVFAYLLLLTAVSFARACFADPGRVPQGIHVVPDPVPEEYLAGTVVPVDGRRCVPSASTATIKYCQTCRVFRPPRAHHCSRCGYCVDVYDHHCIWLNACVGIGNYPHFFTFVVSVVSVSLMCIGIGVFHVVQVGVRESPLLLMIAIYAFLGVWFPGLLLVFHTWVILTGTTTLEWINSRRSRH